MNGFEGLGHGIQDMKLIHKKKNLEPRERKENDRLELKI